LVQHTNKHRRVPSYKTPTNSKWNLQFALHVTNATKTTSFYLKEEKMPTKEIIPKPDFKSGLAQITPHTKDLSNAIPYRITGSKMSPITYGLK
jgi:hypothetical protein